MASPHSWLTAYHGHGDRVSIIGFTTQCEPLPPPRQYPPHRLPGRGRHSRAAKVWRRRWRPHAHMPRSRMCSACRSVSSSWDASGYPCCVERGHACVCACGCCALLAEERVARWVISRGDSPTIVRSASLGKCVRRRPKASVPFPPLADITLRRHAVVLRCALGLCAITGNSV